MSKSVALRHYQRILSRWPSDPLRPGSQFQALLRKRIDRTFGDGTTTTTAPSVNERAELAQVNALYSLLENRYDHQFALRGTLSKPASNPNHYTDLLEELDQAPKRSWLQATLNRWKGFIRLQ